MIEILPENLSSFIQLVGLQQVGRGRYVPSKLLFAQRRHELNPLEPMWLQYSSGVSAEVISDLVGELIVDGSKSGPIPFRRPRPEFQLGQHSLIWARTSDEPHDLDGLLRLWEGLLLDGEKSERKTLCPNCGRQALILWKDVGCTGCLVQGLASEPGSWRWIVMGAPPLLRKDLMDLKLFIWVWDKVGCCPRCSSRRIRVKRIFLDFPKTRGPIIPLWEMDKGDLRPEVQMRRETQWKAFTRGIMRATVECPQCGFMEMEFIGDREGERFPPIPWDGPCGKG